jgi:hypothetical protein
VWMLVCCAFVEAARSETNRTRTRARTRQGDGEGSGYATGQLKNKHVIHSFATENTNHH